MKCSCGAEANIHIVNTKNGTGYYAMCDVCGHISDVCNNIEQLQKKWHSIIIAEKPLTKSPKPCYNCGSTKVEISMLEQWTVYCVICGANATGNSKQEAVEKWNGNQGNIF